MSVIFDASDETARKARLSERVAAILDSSCTAVFLLVYVVLALCITSRAPSGWDAWAVYWPVVFFGGVPGSTLRAIKRHRWTLFPIWSITCPVYLFIGTYTGVWHPYWVILLLIPVYYMITAPIDKLIHDKELGRI